jgi:hypothetical protein
MFVAKQQTEVCLLAYYFSAPVLKHADDGQLVEKNPKTF